MTSKKSDYEQLLAEYSNPLSAIALLKQYRPYLEAIPSLRRAEESLITIPLPIVRLRQPASSFSEKTTETRMLPCELAILMCDPEWKIKTGIELFIFIHRPDEDFSDLLRRWRQIQVWLDKDYEWVMPPRHKHIFSEGAIAIHPLFVVFPETPERIKKGLLGANLPFVPQVVAADDEEIAELSRENV
ncbi:MAG: hypothetical protein KME01_07460 [Chroococcus sp. CMT-3BRIN-NPC107]|jgi:hypothetical protein|nr:hypothetical protein [Chroococcus sp. CMT-3BRIN-NPC107]